MTTNQRIESIFQQMASALELLGENRFRVNSYARAARLIGDLTEDLKAFVEREPTTASKRLEGLPGIGKGTAEKILEYLETGVVSEHAALMDKVPAGLFDILDIPGLGPKAVKALWEQMEIEDLASLENALDDEALLQIPRMGKKTIENIRQAIDFNKRSKGRVPLGRAWPIASGIREGLLEIEGVHRAEIAGSSRRGRDTIGDLDFLVTCENKQPVFDRFCEMEGVTQILARGETKCSVRLERDDILLQADLRLIDDGSFGAAMMYFTGSKEHNVRLREAAIRKGMRLNEYGLYEGQDERPQDGDKDPIAAAREEDIYAALDLAWVPPELREDRGEFEKLPESLIELADIGAELHAHTTASDGKLSIEELALEAKGRGLHTLAVTDHSVSSVLAGGLDVDRLRRHIDEVRDVDDRLDGIRVLAGSEVDILVDGSLDYEDDVLSELDIVIASPHASLRQDPETATRRLLRAIDHPLVHVLGHPTGRLIGMREGLTPDMNAIFAAAAKNDVALEINAHWQRLDLRDIHVRGAIDAGCKIAINTDAHRAAHFDYLHYGVRTARRGGLERERCINTWDSERLVSWLRSKK